MEAEFLSMLTSCILLLLQFLKSSLAMPINVTLAPGIDYHIPQAESNIRNFTIPSVSSHVTDFNGTHSVFRGRTKKDNGDDIPHPGRELPIPIIIASPVAAVSIVIFVCVAYKWHTIQLDQKAKEIVAHLAEIHSEEPLCNVPKIHVPMQSRGSDSELYGQRRKSLLRTPTPPPGLGSKRGSSWSALADQEIVHSASPRRHSTFIL
ncbi:hypothetical protein CHS0354_041858 [Potamilus streckersoni]|uniref:Uncharacterized protein n=1 Tax=Potamilus streckersoni TaxID=2493646 RepID=A0AAE0STN9_9BIVA|nr:hypothetical protein CHS0354_041858 [Potamilus streckersoni]